MNTFMNQKEFIRTIINEKKDLMIQASDTIFHYAEVGFREFKTVKLYEEILKQEGGCTLRKKASGENPDGHGCGHNLLGVGAMAAAIAVKNYLETKPEAGTVILFGCPSEEKGNGRMKPEAATNARFHLK